MNETESPQEWQKRHEGHATEELELSRSFELRSLYCRTCSESGDWTFFKGKWYKYPSNNGVEN